jgi:DNA-binding transcriptional LysR family regulator
MEWDRLRIFYHIAKAGSITRAAEQLNISQPALSRSLQLLEYRLKAKLFERTARGIKLTNQGEILLKHTCNMMNEFSVATKTMNSSSHEEEPSGPLKILTNHSTVYSWLIHYIGEFMELFPKVRIAINCDNNRQYDNDTDTYIGPYLPNRPDLIQIYVKTFYMKLFAGKKYLEKFGVPHSSEDLDHHRLITFKSGSYLKSHHYPTDWMLQLGRKKGHVREPYIQVNSSHALFNAARNNLGIITTGKEYPILEKVDDLVEVLPDCAGPSFDIYYTYPLQMKSTTSIVKFGDYLKEKFIDEKNHTEGNSLENLDNTVYPPRG